jgi:outer membrane lipase/esterase
MIGLLDDYAVAGATSSTQVNGAPPDWPYGVKSQIEQYWSSHQFDPDALYIIWTGHNDIFIPLFQDPMGDFDAARIAFVKNMKHNIKTLWTAGARHILVVNIADIGKTPPISFWPDYSAFCSAVAASFNEGLAGVLKELAAEGVPTIAADAFAIVDTVVAHPAQFGFSNVTVDPFPENPSGYAFFGGHPSTQFHQVLAQFVVRDLIDYFSPSHGKGMPPAKVNALNGLVRAGKQ